ncbi:hypothetical protein FQR65_LT12339 [Abscondita terminalis]|nr:hypothetical protein FQR65_LT12339 [Abscondita terminalis]
MSPLVAAQGLSSGTNRPGTGAYNSAHSSFFPSTSSLFITNRGWSASCLRPAPPLRPCLALGATPNGSPIRTSRKPSTYKEDALILDVIEAYCSNGKPKNTVNAVEVHSYVDESAPEADKMVDSIKLIKYQLKNLEINLATLSSQLTEERGARCALQTIVKSYIAVNCKDFDSIEWPTMESNILN